MKGEGDLYRQHADLLDNLFRDYDKLSRPTPHSQYPVNVTLGIAVAQLVKVVSKKTHFIFWFPVNVK